MLLEQLVVGKKKKGFIFHVLNRNQVQDTACTNNWSIFEMEEIKMVI